MVYDGILLALVIGFLRGGSLKGFADITFKMGWVFPALLLFQFLIFSLQNKISWIGEISSFSFMAVYVIGLTFLWINRHHSHFKFIFFGVLLNFIVMLLNGGRMPVSYEAALLLDPYYLETTKDSLYAKHALMNDSTILSFLGDIIPLKAPYPREQIISIGDVIMNIGAFLSIQSIMVQKKKSINPETVI
ncbi:hypothetical protein JOC75_004348 [Metabacillus crassostreae]|uniref:DUF5317 domain-containing protein n=1 Tax=Metabacillus crassostreae TaxID=929098 RepID=UPI00195B5B1E|nr:DUF5317 domain-containing protein [Metabacillus crassostreae]MBM7606300.1 hypothetical protein [Metabacillus crassostreae]